MSMYGVEYSGIDCGTEGGAKQSFKEECDINTIVAQYAKTGLLTPVVQRPPEFVDVSEVGDYRTALEHVRIADDMFMQLGSAIRGEFENDPAIFLDFCTDPQNDYIRHVRNNPGQPKENHMDTLAIEKLRSRLRNTMKRQQETLDSTKSEYEQLELLLTDSQEKTATPKK